MCQEAKRYSLAGRRLLNALFHEETAIRANFLSSSAEEYVLVHPGPRIRRCRKRFNLCERPEFLTKHHYPEEAEIRFAPASPIMIRQR